MNIVICDDEKFFCEKLRKLLVNYMRNKGHNFIISEFNDGVSLIEQYYQGKSFDIIFLDIKMAKINGCQTAWKIRQFDNSVVIIFLTNVFDFVREGYKLNIFRFLIKSKLDIEFDEALSCAITKRQMELERKYVIKKENELICIPLDDIYYFESQRKKVTAFTIKGKQEFYGKISDVEKHLFNKGFVMPYKGYVVNADHIIGIKENNLNLDNNKSIPISRKYYKSIMNTIAYSMEG